ncbi:MAG: carbohydrate-binding protein [Phycisphaeraceae bacterium]
MPSLLVGAVLNGLVVAVVCLSTSTTMAGTTWYVDYEGGSDTAAGTAPDAAFKHAPGDPAARGSAARATLSAGDTVRFKGGVTYRGAIEVKWSGRADEPIVYDGNTAGHFGEGPAVLDGGEAILDWQPCASADACGGNEHWRNIYTARVPAHAGLTALSFGLAQGEQLVFPSQYPNPDEPFYSGNQDRYLDAEASTNTTLRDARLKEIGAEHLVGALAYVRAAANSIEQRRITDFDAGTGTIHVEQTRRAPTGRFAIANALHSLVLDGPGQYVFTEQADADGMHRVYVWPWDDADPRETPMSYNVRDAAIDFGNGREHVTVQGLKIQNYGTAVRGREARGVTIRGNEITRIQAAGDSRAIAFTRVRDHVVADNHIHHCPRTNAVQTHTGQNVVYRGNTVRMVARSPMRFYNVQHGQIIDNVITDSRGVHSNALTIYVGSRDILVARNEVHRSNIALTLQNAERIYVINNILTSNGSAVGLWPGSTSRQYYLLNNFIGTSDGALFVNHRDAAEFVISNNVFTGIGGYPLDDSHTLSHNLYVGLPTALREGEFFVDALEQIVRDPASDDFQPVAAGPTVDMGVDVSRHYPRDLFPDFDFDVDFAGQPRRHGDAVDIGPYEQAYAPGALADRAPIVTGPEAAPGRPIDEVERVHGAEPIVIAATSHTGQDGGEVVHMTADTMAAGDFIRGWNSEGHWIEYTVAAPTAGAYELSLRYAADIAAPRRVMVNGQTASGLSSIEFDVTGGWGKWRRVALPSLVQLDAGENVIRFVSLGGRGMNLDELRFSRDGQDDITITAGAFTGEGGADDEVAIVPSPHQGLFMQWNAEGHWLEWTVDDAPAGRYEVRLRYATLAHSPRQLSVNGEVAEHLDRFVLDRTAGWRVCNDASLPAPIELREGRNVIRMTSLGGNGLNLDEIRLIPVR